jgi:hypothetical protein
MEKQSVSALAAFSLPRIYKEDESSEMCGASIHRIADQEDGKDMEIGSSGKATSAESRRRSGHVAAATAISMQPAIFRVERHRTCTRFVVRIIYSFSQLLRPNEITQKNGKQ